MAVPQAAGCAVINHNHAAFFLDGKVYYKELSPKDDPPREVPCPMIHGQIQPILTISSTSLLAVSNGSNVVIFDLLTCSIKLRASTKGRAVTALAFSPDDPNTIAAGLVDGRVCTWDLSISTLPLYLHAEIGEYSHTIAFSFNDGSMLASMNGHKISVWNLRRRFSKPVYLIDDFDCETIAWHPKTSWRLAATSKHGELRLYDLPTLNTVEERPKTSNVDGDDSSDDGMFGELDAPAVNLRPTLIRRIGMRLGSASYVSESALFGLSKNGLDAIIVEPNDDGQEIEVVWSKNLAHLVDTAIVRDAYGTLQLVSVGNQGVKVEEIPIAIGRLTGHSSQDSGPAVTSSKYTASTPVHVLKRAAQDVTQKTAFTPTMRPVSLTSSRLDASSFAKTSKQLQKRLCSSSQNNRTPQHTSNNMQQYPLNGTSTPPQPRSMTSSLELQKPREEEIGSPMPFLSPSIPSRKVSPNSIIPLDESTLTLPPLPEASFDHTTLTTPATPSPGQDSDDSDDETFVDGMQGSTKFLPGGINVPLPKACGALFGTNGQLLTFFPPKVRPPSAFGDTEPEDNVRERRGTAERVARLFPTFGNFNTSFRSRDSDSDFDSDSMHIEDEDIKFASLRTEFSFQPASFPGQQSWKDRVSPTKLGPDHQQILPKIVVQIHEIKDVPDLYPTQRHLAERFRVLCTSDESGSEVCEHNADVAEEAGLLDVAELWRFAATLLEGKVPLDVLSFDNMSADILVIARTSKWLLRSDSGVDVSSAFTQSGFCGQLRWANHPFGGSWLVRKMLEWAEEQADVQLMACLSAVFFEAEESMLVNHTIVKHDILTELPTFSPGYFTDASGYVARQSPTCSVPLLRTDTIPNSPSIHRSPIKLLHHPSTSTQSFSHPTTPYLESESPTTPFNLPSMSRQSTRVSTPGSVSPEINRGSFSAAAKYYAQSITDKFSSYGTSPPSKKLGTSPSTVNELSSSLPNGSWAGKSVSFASSTTSTDMVPQINSFGSGYDGAGPPDHTYDSDKTLDDSSAPQTPKGFGSGIAVTMKNHESFTNELSGCVKARLLPNDLNPKAKIWCQYYAEQLRSWNLLIQACELEKVAGLTIGVPPTFDNINDNGIIGALKTGRGGNSCVICLSLARDVYQACLSCRHVSHLECLEDYVADLSDEEDFTCPTGCGCRCAVSPFVVDEVVAAPPLKPNFRKKASFTDPRKWRARIEGDSW